MLEDGLLRKVFTSLVAVIFLLALHRHYISDSRDPYHCTALLNEGQWLDEPGLGSAQPAFQKWQPTNCLLHDYRGADIGHCSETRQLLFVGDSNVRQLFWATARKLNHREAVKASQIANHHGTIEFAAHDAELRFVWDPYLNGSILENELQIYAENVGSGPAEGNNKKAGKKEQSASMIILGAGLWFARQFDNGQAVQEFKSTIDRVAGFTGRKDGRYWKARSPFVGWEGIGDQVILLPLDEPIYDLLSPSRHSTIKPDEIDQMNAYLRKLSPSQGLTVPWVFQVMTGHQEAAYEHSGLHILDSITNRRVDVLLNFRCNAKDDNAMGSPYERTCCSGYTSGNWFPWVLAATSLIMFLAAALYLPTAKSYNISTEAQSLLHAIAAMGLALAYCFFTDRSQLFTKVQKVYYGYEVFTLSVVGLILGLATIRKTTCTITGTLTAKDGAIASKAPFLPREQTDEWKGWMSIFVLLYHWTAADTQLPMYIFLRLLIASYLFVSSYGHTIYFFQTQDYSIKRIGTVLLRVNLLTVAMSYQMYNHYLDYHFAGQVSFWFLIVFATLGFGSELNTQPGFLLSKILMSAALVGLIHTRAQPTDFMFDILRSLCHINWNAGDWRALVSLDSVIPYIGMLVALLRLWYQNAISSISSTGKPLYRNTQWSSALLLRAFPFLRVLATTLAIVVIPVFILLVSRSPNQGDYDWWAPLISLLPILSYVILRNSCSLFREYHSAAFAWLGRCSLELWTLSYHILRAADGKGVLSIGVFSTGDGSLTRDRWRDFVLLAPVMVWTAWQVSCAKREIIRAFLDDASLCSSQHTLSGDEKLPRRLEKGVGKRLALLVVGLWVLNLVS